MGRKRNDDRSITEIVREPYGKLSFSRLSGFVLLLHYILSSVYIMMKTNKIPDLPTNHLILITALYGINRITVKVQDVIKNIASK